MHAAYLELFLHFPSQDWSVWGPEGGWKTLPPASAPMGIYTYFPSTVQLDALSLSVSVTTPSNPSNFASLFIVLTQSPLVYHEMTE